MAMSAWGADAQLTRTVEQHGTALLRLAVLLTGNRHDGEDALQNAIIAVAGSWRRTRPRAALAYLRRAVANECFHVHRGRDEVIMPDVPERMFHDHAFLRYEDDQRFFALLANLPEKQRATLILRYFADLDDHVIGEILECSVETVRSQASRAIAKLRESETALEINGPSERL
jgi:RNA polymerase sigma factor (sigma-70 family)